MMPRTPTTASVGHRGQILQWQFENDGCGISTIVELVMAAEYSGDLSDKVSAGKKHVISSDSLDG